MLKRLKEWKVVWLLAVFGLGCRVLPAVISYRATGHSLECEACTSAGLLTIDLVQKIGDALIIACVLALTVDTYLKKKIVEEVSAFVRGSHLPVEIRFEIDRLVRIDLFRSDYEQTYELTEEGSLVKLKTTASFFMNNPSNNDQEYTQSVTFQKLPGKFFEITRMGASGILDTKGKMGDYDELCPEPKEENGNWLRKRDCLVPANGRTRFWYETVQTLNENDTLIFYSKQTTVRYRISINYPQSFDVRVHFGHYDPRSIKKFPEDRPTVWSLSGALLPMSAVTINWNKRSTSPAITASTPTPNLSVFAKAREVWNRWFATHFGVSADQP